MTQIVKVNDVPEEFRSVEAFIRAFGTEKEFEPFAVYDKEKGELAAFVRNCSYHEEVTNCGIHIFYDCHDHKTFAGFIVPHFNCILEKDKRLRGINALTFVLAVVYEYLSPGNMENFLGFYRSEILGQLIRLNLIIDLPE